jgi:3-isopropylmalate/(R)-2-methylmalate dehydratase small subunit
VPIERVVKISGTALPLPGDNIDTDRIIPARFLRSVSFEGLEDHLFEDDRAQVDAQAPGTHPFSNPRYTDATVLVVNANFGCGSSREHAPQAIRRRGFRAVVGESFSEIFFGNSVAIGMPCVSVSKVDADALLQITTANPQTVVEIDLSEMNLRAGDRSFAITLPAAARDGFLDGSWDATGLLLDRYEEVEAVATRLPYVRGFQDAL